MCSFAVLFEVYILKFLVLHDYGSNVEEHSFNLYDNTWKKEPILHGWSITETA